MRILHITPEAPGAFSGGQIGVRQTLYSLSENNYEIDYIGPEIKDAELKSLYSRTYELEPVNNIVLRIYDSLRGITNSRYRAWKELTEGKNDRDFCIDNYDAAIMDFTKLDYAAENIPGEKLIVRVHNVEADFFAREFEHNRNIKTWVLKKTAGSREHRVIENAAKLLVLTENDRNRIKELYGVKDNAMCIMPICIKNGLKPNFDNTEKRDKIKILITGSLWFGPNYDGIKWFIEKVFNRISSPKELIIAGARPNSELKALAAKYSENTDQNGSKDESIITIAASPEDMSAYFMAADIVAAPVFDGAGMKVKVAEALSYALPIVGTKHAFTGYKIADGINSRIAENEYEFANAINEYAAMDREKRIHVRKAAYKCYTENYSQTIGTQIMKNEIENLISKNITYQK